MRRGWVLLACGALAACSQRAPLHGIRNVVLVSCDTLRADALGAFFDASRGADHGGLERTASTPNLDRLAREGVRLRALSTAAPSTLASHTSLFSGLYPHDHGVVRNGFVLSEECPTLAKSLHAAGFATLGFIGSFALDRRFGVAQGFEVWNQDFDELADGNVHEQNERRAAKVTDAALAALERPGAFDAPTLVFVHYFDVHAPYAPPDCETRSVDGVPISGSIDDLRRAVALHQASFENPPRGLDRAILEGLPPAAPLSGFEPLAIDRELERRYLGEIEYVDRELGRLFDGLERRGRLADSLIVFVADHGESFFEHADFFNHGLAVYDTTVHVPCILRFPDGAFAGQDRDAPISNVDLAPTILELVGLAVAKPCDGASLVPLLEHRDFPARAIFGGATQPGAAEVANLRWTNDLKAQYVRVGELKLIQTPYLKREELYDLSQDPYERNNLLALPGSLDERLRAKLGELRAQLEAWRESARPLPSHFDRHQSEEVQQRLRSLGYTEAQK